MREVVALDCTGDVFVRALRQAWDQGHAVAPIDPRLPPPARRTVLATLRPTQMVDPEGDRAPMAGGEPTEDGDALVIVTSGTTGEPKAVVLTHEAVSASALATTRRLGVDT